MTASNPKVANRLSSFFSLGTHDSKNKSSDPQSPNDADLPRGRTMVGGPRKTSVPSNPSGQYLTPTMPGEPWGVGGQQDPTVNGQMADLSLTPPPPIFVDTHGRRSSSRPGSRPASPISSRPGSRATSPVPQGDHLERPGTPNANKRRTWMPSRSRNASQNFGVDGLNLQRAWVKAGDARLIYDLSTLERAQKVPDLWNEQGDTYIYLFPRASRKAPSFKLESSIFASSPPLTYLAHGGNYGAQGRGSVDRNGYTAEPDGDLVFNVPVQTPPAIPSQEPVELMSSEISSKDSSQGSRMASDFNETPTRETHLYFPSNLSTDDYVGPMEPRLMEEDLERLVTIRNFFAFLTRQPLVNTPTQPSYFDVFVRIADLLQQFEFGNLDGSNFGETAAGNFQFYIHEHRLDDMRGSREKTIEGLILAERMRSESLYNEAFVHAVGKYDDIHTLKSPKYDMIGDLTRKRLERAAMDLGQRLQTIRGRLNEFDFPSLFAGIANSTTLPEAKMVNFKIWKNSFLALRRHVIGYYKVQYGSWPPKARSKKNDFEESGLNRILLKELNRDFADLYDLLVDRTALTTRSIDGDSEDLTHNSALRKVLSEYDRSSPPVQPPMPYDAPLLPAISPLVPGGDLKIHRKHNTRKVKEGELDRILRNSYNNDSVKRTPFIDAFLVFERKQAHGQPVHDIADQRYGHWLFLYTVMQSLPMLIVDAPGIRWGHNVEYFLCEPPKGGLPWGKDKDLRRRSWYGIAGGQMVNLPSDVVDYGVEGVYQRSHAWEMAQRWGAPGFIGQLDPPSPVRERRSSVGLEALPVPQGVLPTSRSRASSMHDPNKSFEDIIGK